MPYLWRRLTAAQRVELLACRKRRAFPWHSPPHAVGGIGRYHLTAACLDHKPHIGYSPERISGFCEGLLAAIKPAAAGIHACCVLPNHYHLLVSLPDLRTATSALGKLHGRTAFEWNNEEAARNRHVWFRAADRFMRGERHF